MRNLDTHRVRVAVTVALLFGASPLVVGVRASAQLGGDSPSSTRLRCPACTSGSAGARPVRRSSPSSISFASVLPSQPAVERLPNGLTVVTVQGALPGVVAYLTMVRVGSRDEVDEDERGLAHLVEHLMFSGFEQRLESAGARAQGYTTEDYTLYELIAPSSALPTIVALEADRIQRPRYTDEQLRIEAGVVRAERRFRPREPMDALEEHAFTRHTYRHPVIGSSRAIDALPARYTRSRRFVARHYTPDNTFLVVVGDFDRAELLARVHEAYGGWRGRHAPVRVRAEPSPTRAHLRELSWEGGAGPQVLAGWRVPGFEPARRGDRAEGLRETAALQVLGGLAFSAGSPHARRLAGAHGLHGLRAQHALRRDPTLFVVAAGLTSPAGQPLDAAAAVDVVQAELTRIAEGEVSAALVRAAQRHLRDTLEMSFEDPTILACFLVDVLGASGRFDAIDELLTALERVSAEDISRVAARYLVPERRFAVTLTPGVGAPRRGGAR